MIIAAKQLVDTDIRTERCVYLEKRRRNKIIWLYKFSIILLFLLRAVPRTVVSSGDLTLKLHACNRGLVSPNITAG